MRTHSDPEGRQFRRVWRQLSDVGCCAAWGGAESRRVLREWEGAGRPGAGDEAALRRYVARRANAAPGGGDGGAP